MVDFSRTVNAPKTSNSYPGLIVSFISVNQFAKGIT
jgi:hypothetical protein